VDGYRLSINVDQIAVTAENRRVVKIAHAALSRIEMSRSRNTHQQLRSLGRGMRTGLRQGTDWLLSPYAPLGLVVVPGTLAWGAVAAPFCLVGDLKNKVKGRQEIKVI
jgi:hypothetical protein